MDPNIPGSPGNNSGGAGRVCLPEYIQLGYIPTNCTAGSAQVSRSMNYWHSDLAISNAATVLGEKEDADTLLARSRNWKNLYDGKTGHFRPKHFNGSFTDRFDEFAWGPGPGYTEAGPYVEETEKKMRKGERERERERKNNLFVLCAGL